MADAKPFHMDKEWEELAPYDGGGEFSLPLIFNNNELLVVPYSTNGELTLYKYNIVNNKWHKWFKCKDEVHSTYHTASLNDDNTILYLFNEEGRIIEIDLISKKSKISLKKFHDGSRSQSIFFENKFHIFGGW